MKSLRFLPLLSTLAASLLLAVPVTSFAGNGHYNNRCYGNGGGYYGGRGYYGGGYYSGPRIGFYGGGYRPYAYGGPGPYFWPYLNPWPAVSFTYTRQVAPVSRASYSDDLAVDVQRELRRRGYYRGAIDGDVGPGTRAAIRAYQGQRGLVVTGRIDRSLLLSLGIA